MSKKSIFVFLFIILYFQSLPSFAQRQGVWSTVANDTTLPSIIPKAGYVFYKYKANTDSTLYISTGKVWQRIGGDSTIGTSIVTARQFTGWTATGTLGGTATDTLATKFILNDKAIQFIVVDADNDSVKIKSQDKYPLKIVDGSTFIAGIDSTGKLGLGVEPTRATLEQPVLSLTDAIFGGTSRGIGIMHNPPAIGFNSYNDYPGKSISAGYGARIQYDALGGFGMFFLLSNASVATDAEHTYPTAAFTIDNSRIGMGTNISIAKAFLEQAGKIGQTAAIFGKDGAGVGITEDDPAIIFNGYDDGTNKKAIAPGFVGYVGLEDGTGNLKFASTSSSGSANGNVTLLNRLYFEPDGDAIISGGSKAPMSGTISISGKDLVISREGTIANSDSSAALRIVTGLGDLLLKNRAGNGVEVKINTSDDMELITLATASVSITNGSFAGNSLIRGLDQFSGTSPTDTVLVSGGTTSDFYFIEFISALEATITSRWVEALTDKFVVHLEGTITTGNDFYTWFRLK